jgi:pantothenate kinase
MTAHVTHLDDLLTALTTTDAEPRRLVAIVGPPGSGKSTISEALFDRLNQAQSGSCAIVPMDGFHFDDDVLRDRGRLARKGAPDTFDVGGLIALHKRLATNEEPEIAVPLFDRARELSRAGARVIDPSVQTILVEGNYLLLNQAPWDRLLPFYDLTIQIDVNEDELKSRLEDRWRIHGFSAEEGQRRVAENDLPNARFVVAQSRPADLVYKAAD